MKNANFLLRSVRKLYMYMSQRMLRYKRKFRHTEDKIITFKGNKTKEKLLNDQKNKRPPGHITHLSNRFTISNMAILSIFNDIIQFVLTSDYCPTEKDIMPFLKKKMNFLHARFPWAKISWNWHCAWFGKDFEMLKMYFCTI